MAPEIRRWLVSRMSQGDRENYEERAAIIEFDGGMPRDKAEALAYQATLDAITARHTQHDLDRPRLRLGSASD